MIVRKDAGAATFWETVPRRAMYESIERIGRSLRRGGSGGSLLQERLQQIYDFCLTGHEAGSMTRTEYPSAAAMAAIYLCDRLGFKTAVAQLDQAFNPWTYDFLGESIHCDEIAMDEDEQGPLSPLDDLVI